MQEQTGINATQQKLIYKGVMLNEDDKTLAQLGIFSGQKLRSVIKFDGGF